MSNYRPVRVYHGKDHSYEGMFLEFAVNYDKFQTADGRVGAIKPYTSAIIQREGGTVENVPLFKIKFLD